MIEIVLTTAQYCGIITIILTYCSAALWAILTTSDWVDRHSRSGLPSLLISVFLTVFFTSLAMGIKEVLFGP